MYTKGEVIWAKIKGFPWWPGVVAKVIEEKENTHGIMEILVNFVGENSHAQLPLDKVAKYKEKYDEYAKMKKKKLLSSIEIANKILKGETTFQAEYEKLEEKSDIIQKKLTAPTQRKRGDSKSDDKSPSNGMQEESDLTSPNDSDANHLTMSPNDKEAKKPKVLERKDSKKGAGLVVSRKTSQVEKSPAINKSLKNRVNSKREGEDYVEAEEPRLMKAFKLDGNTDENHPPKSKEDDLTARSDKTLKSPYVFNGLDAAFISNNASIEVLNTKNSRKNSSALISSTQWSESSKGRTSEFDEVREMIIERILNNGSPSVCGTILEKSIEDVISKINPETVSISEIVENDLGKNIYTLIILLDELLSSGPQVQMETESELSDIKDKLVNFNDIIKNRLALHYVENVDYCSGWLKKLEQKREQKAALKAIENSMTKSPQVMKPEKVEKMPKMSRQSTKELENSSNRLEEEQNLEEEKTTSVLQINFDNYRFESDKKKPVLSEREGKMMTISAKINKPIYAAALEVSKVEVKQKTVTNPTLRKKICLKMSKILQEKYNLEKNNSQEMTLKIETKIRNLNPDMQMEYKNKILIVLKLLKYSLIDIQDFVNDFNMDFYVLREKLDAYHKQHGETPLDANFGEDSPSLAKEISQNSALINLKMDEFKRGENQESIAQIA